MLNLKMVAARAAIQSDADPKVRLSATIVDCKWLIMCDHVY